MRRKKAKIKIGPNYQADIPDLLVLPTHTTHEPLDESIKIWAPTESISEIKFDEFILLSKEKYGYNTEQAMGMLYWHNYNLENAIGDLPNFSPIPNDWTPKDTILFETAFSKFGKNFSRIKRMMPDKSIATLVKQYYLGKHNNKKRCENIDLDVQRRSNLSDLDDKIPNKSLVTLIKYFYLWRRRTRKRKKQQCY